MLTISPESLTIMTIDIRNQKRRLSYHFICWKRNKPRSSLPTWASRYYDDIKYKIIVWYWIYGIVYQRETFYLYLQAHNRLLTDLDGYSMEVVESQSFATEVTTALEKLKEKDVRIILGNFNEAWARRIFCEAYRYANLYNYKIIYWISRVDYG